MYRKAYELEVIAEEIIRLKSELYHIREQDIAISYFYKENAPNDKAYASCQKVSGILTFYTNQDFLIVFNEDKVEELTPAQLEILIYHELLHIGDDGKLNNHNVEDFYTILDTYGIGWIHDDSLKGILRGDKNE